MGLEAGLGFGAAIVLGLSFGAGACAVTCLPYLGPVLFAQGGGIRQSRRIVLPFSLGRMLGYTGLAAVAGLAADAVNAFLASAWTGWLLGGATLLLGLLLWRRAGRPPSCRSRPRANGGEAVLQFHKPQQATTGGLLLMGAGMAFNPCVPLSTVIVAAAATGSVQGGALLGLGFGLGAVIIPALIFGLGVAHLGHELGAHLGRWKAPMQRTGAGLLMALGAATLMGFVSP